MKIITLLFSACLLLFSFSAFAPSPDSAQEIPPRIKNVDVLDPLKYPLKAVRKKIDGLVKVEVEVDESGAYVAHNVVESASEILAEAIEPFVPQLKFYPAEVDGKASSGIAILEVRFEVVRRVPIKTEISIKFLSPSVGQ